MANQSASLNIDINARDGVTRTVKGIESSIIRFVGAISASLAAIKAISFPIREAADFERALADVRKTTGFTEAEIVGLSSAIRNMSTELAVGQTELANIAATAGQLGLGAAGADAIVKFTESVARATVTFGLAEDQVSTFAAQLLNVFNIDASDTEKLFSSINELSNNSVASAQNLFDVMRRVGSIAGLTATDVGALAATTADFGITSEVAGTSLVKAFSNMQSNAESFARVMNVTTTEWTNSVQTDALGALKGVANALSQLDVGARAGQIRTLFGGGRVFSTFNKLVNDAANGFQVLDKNIGNATSAYASGVSSIQEYEKVSETFRVQLDLVGNAVRELAIGAGDRLLPVLTDLAKQLQTALADEGASDALRQIAEQVEGLITLVVDVVKELSEWDEVWRNIIPAIKVFLGFQLAKTFLGIGLSIGRNVSNIAAVTASWSAATAAAKKYVTAAVTASNTATRANAAGAGAAGVAGATAASTENTNAVAAVRTRKEQILQNRALLKQQTQRLVALKEEKVLAQVNRKEYVANNAELRKLANSHTKAGAAASRSLDIARKAYQKTLRDINKNIAATKVLRTETIATGASIKASNAVNTAALAGVVRGTSKISSFSSVAAAASAGISGLIKNIGRFGKALLAFAGGPIGLAITGLIVFGEEIANLLGFVTDTDALDAANSERNAVEEARRQAESVVSAYREAIRRGVSKVNRNIGTVLAEQGVGDAASKIRDAITEVGNLSTQIEGGQVVQQSLNDVIAETSVGLQNNIAKQEEFTAKIDESREVIRNLNDRLSPSGRSFTDLGIVAQLEIEEANLSAVLKEQEAVEEQIRDNRDDLSKYEKALAKTVEGVQSLFGRTSLVVAELGEVVTVELREFVRFQSVIRETEDQLKALDDSRRDILSEIGKLGPDGDPAEIARLEQSLSALNNQTKATTRDFEDLRDTSREMKGNLLATDAVLVSMAENADKVSFARLSESLDKIDLTTQQAVADKLKDSIVQAGISIGVNRRLLEDFNEFRKPLDDILARVKSVFDNIGSSTNAALDNMRKFGDSLRQIGEDAATERAINKELRESEKILSRINALRNSDFDKRIASAEAAGNTRRANSLREEQDALNKIADTRKTLADAERVRRVAEEANNKALDNVAAKNKEIAEAVKASAEEQKRILDSNISEPEKVTAFTALAESIVDLKSESEELLEIAKTTTKAFAELGGTEVPANQFSTESLKPLVSQEDADKQILRLEAIGEASARVGREAATEAARVGSLTSSFLDAGATKFSAPLEASRKVIDAIAKSAPAAATGITSVLNLLDSSVGKLGIFTQDLEGVSQGLKNIGDAGKNITLEINPLTQAEIDKLVPNLKIEANPSLFSDSVKGIVSNVNSSGETPPLSVGVDESVLVGSVNDALRGQTFTANVRANVSGAAVGAATGGYISGPGTGTSDSILAALSNGEYVIKAQRVREMGRSFFDMINYGGKVPKFATGGLVGPGEGSLDSVDVNLLTDAGSYKLKGPRGEVRELVRNLKNIRRK